jgi:hypothetical protein
VGFDITGQLQLKYSAVVRYWRKNRTVHQLFRDFEKAYDSVRREALYSIFTEFGIHMRSVRLIIMYLNEVHGKVHIGKNLSMDFIFRMLQKRKGFITIAFQLCFKMCHQEGMELNGTQQLLSVLTIIIY